jgi:hypothetical protein
MPAKARGKAAPAPPETQYFVPWRGDARRERDTTPTAITARLPVSAPARQTRPAATAPLQFGGYG